MANTQSLSKTSFQKVLGRYHYAAFGLIFLLITGYTLYNLSSIYQIANNNSQGNTVSTAEKSFDQVTISKVKNLRFSTEMVSFSKPPGRYNPFGE